MSNLSEEEIIKELNRYIEWVEQYQPDNKDLYNAIEGLLDLYNKEKEEINKLIRYIAVRENKDFEEVKKEFEI